MNTAPLPRSSATLPRLRNALAAAGYNEGSIRTLLAVPGQSPLPPAGHPPSTARARLGQDGDIALLARLLLLGDTLEDEQAEALPASLLSDLLAANLVTLSEHRVVPLLRVTPFHDLLLASDLHNEDSQRVEADAVECPHGPAEVLSRIIPREKVQLSLDIGSGTGVHTFELAGHSASAVGVDISERATSFAKFNADLNGVTNARFKTGDVVDSLKGAGDFDLIVSNAPYLISPESGILYRDGSGTGHVATRVLSEAPALLGPGGLLVCLTSWATVDEADPDREIRAIAGRAGCNALTLVYAVRSPLENAIRWNIHRREIEEIHHTIERWATYYQEHAVKRIAYGIVILSRANGEMPIFHSERVSIAGQNFDQGQIRDILAALSRCQQGRLPDRIMLHPDHLIESMGRIVDGSVLVRDQDLCSARGLAFRVSCGPRLLEAVAAGRLGHKEGSEGKVIAKMARRLYQLGLVVPADHKP